MENHPNAIASSGSGLTRSRFLGRAALAGGGLVVGGVALGGFALPAMSAPSAEQDQRVLNFLLELEELQAAFYADAVERGSLRGESQEFAEVLAGHEREHVDFLRETLGSAAREAGTFDFGEVTADTERFLSTAIELEETGLGAYTGAAVNLTPEALRAAAPIVSVEARHTAWARDLAERNPAPRASDEPLEQDAARRAVDDTGFVRPG